MRCSIAATAFASLGLHSAAGATRSVRPQGTWWFCIMAGRTSAESAYVDSRSARLQSDRGFDVLRGSTSRVSHVTELII